VVKMAAKAEINPDEAASMSRVMTAWLLHPVVLQL
jgi:hypothetical protein